MKDLFVSGLVNKAFYRLITTSPTLQRNLFLLPVKSQPPTCQYANDGDGGPFRAVISSSTPDDSASLWPDVAYGEPKTIARLNPLLKLELLKPFSYVPTTDRCVGNSAILDTRILESRAWPHMYLTDPACTCVHINIDYCLMAPVDPPVLRVRRTVYKPAGGTFGAIYDALHERGFVAMYHRYKYAFGLGGEACLTPDSTIGEQLQRVLEEEGLKLALISERALIEFCHLLVPSDAKLGEMRRCGRVESPAKPEDY